MNYAKDFICRLVTDHASHAGISVVASGQGAASETAQQTTENEMTTTPSSYVACGSLMTAVSGMIARQRALRRSAGQPRERLPRTYE